MEDEEKLIIYNKGIKAGKEHSTPSDKTIRIFSEMDKKVNEKFDSLTDQITEIKIMLARFPEELFCKADSRYAPSWVADAVKVGIYILAGGVLSALVSIVLIKK